MNETLFNNCENGREPDWSLYDGFEHDEIPDFYSFHVLAQYLQ